jgi:predicted DNA binding protein
MVKIIKIMTTEEAFHYYYDDEKLRAEYHNDYDIIDIEEAKESKVKMQIFLDNEALDIERLTEEQCRLLQIHFDSGFYISTFTDEYITTVSI